MTRMKKHFLNLEQSVNPDDQPAVEEGEGAAVPADSDDGALQESGDGE